MLARSYLHLAGATQCLSCKETGFCFSVIPGTGIKQCGLSPPGYFSPSGTDVCMPCPSSKDFGDNGFCDASDCSQSTECMFGGKCQPTPPGYYSYNQTSQCIACPTATKSGSTFCPLETSMSKAGIADCSAAGLCVAGGVCGPVPAGFCSPAGVDACLVCVGSDVGSTTCPGCEAAGFCFFQVPGTQLMQCGLSPPGFYGPAGTEDCLPCVTSYVYGDNGNCDPDCAEATQCMYKGQCLETPVGYYSYQGTSRCIPCPNAAFPGSTTCAVQLAVAVPCSDAGKCLMNGLCVTVPIGFYSPSGAGPLPLPHGMAFDWMHAANARARAAIRDCGMNASPTSKASLVHTCTDSFARRCELVHPLPLERHAGRDSMPLLLRGGQVLHAGSRYRISAVRPVSSRILWPAWRGQLPTVPLVGHVRRPRKVQRGLQRAHDVPQ